MNKNLFKTKLLQWYDSNMRILPWRDDPTPYKVWISEIMLQQTRVEAVIPFFERFTTSLPDIESLSSADEQTLLKLWQSLGYYNRVRNLQKAAIQIKTDHNGIFPNTKEALETLSGIGPYTSGAILSIAFNQKIPAVDGNVLRVFSRLYGIKDNIKDPKTKKLIKETVESVLPDERNGDFNQALMEIGATVCIPNGNPKCTDCPLSSFCIAHETGLTDRIPVIERKKNRRLEDRTVLLIHDESGYLMKKRPEKGLLANMYEFVNIEGKMTEEMVREMLAPMHILNFNNEGNFKHIFTHIEWHMNVFEIKVQKAIMNDYQTYNIQQIKEELPLPNAFRFFHKKMS